MNSQASYVVRMRFKRGNLFVRVVVEDPKLEVVRAGNEPVLARNEAYAADGNISDLKCLHKDTRLVVVDVHGAVVQTGQKPWFGRMEVDAFDAVGAGEEFPLQ